MYEDLIYIRNDDIENISRWYWIKEEVGAWGGPKKDWEDSHKDRYLKHLRKRDVVICAGGNQGMYPRLFSDIFKTVYTFEPDPLNFHCLVNNCQKDNIIKMNCALGAKPQMVHVVRESMTNTGMHTIREEGIVPQLTIDSFAFTDIDFIQLDVEGLEIEVLRGAIESIKKFKPIISAERAHGPVEEFLRELDYINVESSCADTVFKPKEET